MMMIFAIMLGMDSFAVYGYLAREYEEATIRKAFILTHHPKILTLDGPANASKVGGAKRIIWYRSGR